MENNNRPYKKIVFLTIRLLFSATDGIVFLLTYLKS